MDEDLIEVKLDSEDIFDGHLLHVKRDNVRLPNGKTAVREWIAHPGASAVIPLLPDGRVILVRQYRYPMQQITLEIPAGKLDPGEDPLVCATRELTEETGYEAEEIVPLGVFYPSVAILDEKIHLYLARGLTFRATNPDDDEFLNVEQRPLREMVDAVMRGDVPDGKTQTAILKTWLLLQEK